MPDVKVFEFDELLCIPGCTLGKHSNQPPAIEVQRKAETIMAQADKDGDGVVSFDEFVIVSKKFPNILFPAYSSSK